jgi:hypothetical protein
MEPKMIQTFKVTCLDEAAEGVMVRIDASHQRWNNESQAQAYANTVAQSRQPLVEPTAFKVTCLDEAAEGELVRIDASNQRWDDQELAQAYANTVAKTRIPLVQRD